jgi:hypothetical protein
MIVWMVAYAVSRASINSGTLIGGVAQMKDE